MRTLLALAAALVASSTAAATLEPYALQKCQGRDRFEYWTTPPCAAGDKAIAIDSMSDPRKPLSEQIRIAECRNQALKELMKKSPVIPGTASKIDKDNEDHCK